MKELKKILVVDDETAMRKNIADLLSCQDFAVVEAESGEAAITLMNNENIDLFLLDINLPGISGLELLKYAKEEYADIPCLVLTAYGTSERAIEAMKLGAFDYLEKPFELDEFLLIIERAIKYGELLSELKHLRNKVAQPSLEKKNRIVSRDAKMQEIFKTIGRVANTDASVLIQGESGTGKELIADAIQRHSHLKDKPYVKINCGALSESLLESEIFGHEKGAFSGAVAMRAGLFEIADGGTVFLDEINSMPPALQVRLLRILQGQSFFRVGGTKPISVEVRVIAATNAVIEEEVAENNFREDLYYRLNVARINVPPLRERPGDIDILVEYFVQKYAEGRKLILDEQSRDLVNTYHWPGNVRELENTIHRALIMSSDNIIKVDNLTISNKKEVGVKAMITNYLDEGKSLKEIIADVERNVIIEALKTKKYNQSKAANFLQMNRRLLYSKIRDYKIKIK